MAIINNKANGPTFMTDRIDKDQHHHQHKQGSQTNCPLCAALLPGELVRTNQCIIVDAQEPLYPGFTRVIWLDHVREMTDLSAHERQLLMDTVFEVERIMRAHLQPHKVNLASLGNQAPHVHWHVIGRWPDDVAFPNPVWVGGTDTQAAQARRSHTLSALNAYHEALIQRFKPANHD